MSRNPRRRSSAPPPSPTRAASTSMRWRGPATYEHVDPAAVGNERQILVSELSGRNTSSSVRESSGSSSIEDSAGGARGRAPRSRSSRARASSSRTPKLPSSCWCVAAAADYRPPVRAAGVSHRSRKTAADEGTARSRRPRSRVGGEVLRGKAPAAVRWMRSRRRYGVHSPRLPAARGRVSERFPRLYRPGRDGARGTIAVRITASRAGQPAVDDGRQRPRPPARHLARAHRQSGAGGAAARRGHLGDRRHTADDRALPGAPPRSRRMLSRHAWSAPAPGAPASRPGPRR